MPTPQITATSPGDQRRQQRHAGLHQKDVGDGGVGKRDHERGRGGGETHGHGKTRQPHIAEQPQRPAAAIAPDHEADEENSRPSGTPEHDAPAIAGGDEARDGAAEAPHQRRQEHQQDADALVAPGILAACV